MSNFIDGISWNPTREKGAVKALLTDLYQLTMAYAYWKSGKVHDRAVFDLFFRKNPFQGGFTIFAGLEQCLNFLQNFKYSDSDIEYLKSAMSPQIEPEFFEFLKTLTAKDLEVYAVEEGTVVFPRIPLLRIEGPLILVQLLETTLLTLVNFASLVATNAARYRIVAGENVTLLEFGLRRAQGPDGGLSASKYSYIGGFDGTSNVLAGKLFDIPIKGTHAHSYIMSFANTTDDLPIKTLADAETGKIRNLLELTCNYRDKIASDIGALASEASEGELAAFISYAIAFPHSFMALVDTYDVLRSGLLNFCAVALALNELGYKAIGIRIDSGDLAYLSKTAREIFEKISKKFNLPWFASMTIVASNDINEDVISSLDKQGHKIDCFGIGTHLVTCQKQPALGCVFKMAEINEQPRIKLSQEVEKVTIPGKKRAFRLYGADGKALVDLLQQSSEEPPKANEKIFCRHPFEEMRRCYVIPSYVESLHKLYWKDGQICMPLPTLKEIRTRVHNCLDRLRNDHKIMVEPFNYKVSLSGDLYNFMHDLWLQNAPIGELS